MQAKQPKTILVSASLGGIDRVSHIPTCRDFDAVIFTDGQTTSRSDPASLQSWNRVVSPAYPRQDWHPRLRAKYFKLQIHRLEETFGYDYLVWSDAGVSIIDQGFVSRTVESLRELPPWRRLAIFAHPYRINIQQEYEYIISEIANGNEYLTVRYGNEDMAGQLDYYHVRDWNVDGQLLCGGFWIVENSPLMARCFDDWWDHNLRFTIMDQLSLPVVLKKHFIEPMIIEGDLYKSPSIMIGRHDIII